MRAQRRIRSVKIHGQRDGAERLLKKEVGHTVVVSHRGARHWARRSGRQRSRCRQRKAARWTVQGLEAIEENSG